MSSEAKAIGKLECRHYVCFPQDGRRHEIVDGAHIVNPTPNTYHQTLSRKIQFQLYTQIELKGLGQVFDAPTDLQLSDYDIVQPDLIMVLSAHRSMITPIKIKGVPDLVVEIVSESTAHNDRVLKKELYQNAGVPEYWIVDPDEHVVEQWKLQGRVYVSIGRHDTRIALIAIDGVHVDLTQVW